MMEELIGMLHREGVTLVVWNEGVIQTFCQRGIADLYDIYTDNKGLLYGAVIADKVIGKGAAALMVAGGVSKVYADVMSSPALNLLTEAGIEVSYGILVANIWNRTRTDFCPVEKLCSGVVGIDECIRKIEEFVKQNRIGK